jgi:hypothetical protein
MAPGTLSVMKTGTGTVPAPQMLDALMIGQLAPAARDAEWEKWEGVLVTMTNITASGSPQQVGSTDNTFQSFNATGGIVIESTLAAFPSGIVRDTCLGNATGVVDYFFNYLLLPRTTSEITTGGTGCAMKEDATTCGDGIDNDGNGFTDCKDNSCIIAASACRTVTTVNAIQMAAMPPTGGVELQGVYVASLTRPVGSTMKPFNMYVQDAAAAAAYKGIYILGPGTDLSAFTANSKVNIIGSVSEFNDSMGMGSLTEVKALQITAATGNGSVMAVTGQNPTTLTMDATGEPYESVLVKLTNIKLKTVADSQYHVGTMNYNGTIDFKFDDDVFQLPEGGTGLAAGTCFSNITGFWSYQVYDNAWYFLPTNSYSTTGGTCP